MHKYLVFLLLIFNYVISTAHASKTMTPPKERTMKSHGEMMAPDKDCCVTCEGKAHLPQCNLPRHTNDKISTSKKEAERPGSSATSQ